MLENYIYKTRRFKIMNNEKENHSTTTVAQNSRVGKLAKDDATRAENFFTTEEKAQYEVFKNGNLPRETIKKWIENDLGAIISFAHGCLRDEIILKALVDTYYDRYTKLHASAKEANDKP